MNNKKKILIASIISVVIASIGIAYGATTYSRNGTYTNKLVTGDIYMRYNETNNVLSINNAVPSATYDSTKYFEFEIIGKNESNRNIWYEIVLTDGTKPNNKNTKLDDKYLKFTLYKGNTMVVNGASFDDITNQRLYTDGIDANTNNEATTTYKLYMWIDNSVGIGTNADYTIQQWNDIYAAVKVNVNARTETSASCFTLSNKNDTNHTATISAYDATCGGTDIIIPSVIDGYTITEYGSGSFANKGLTNAIIQEGVVTINGSAFYSDRLTTLKIPNSVTTIGGQAFYNNQLASVEIPNSVTSLGGQAFYNNQLTDVTINGNNLYLVPSGDFQNNPIETLTIGANGTVNILGNRAPGVFSNISTLKTVIIGDGVQTIGDYAFSNCGLETLEIGNNVQTIGELAFMDNQLTSVEIPNSVTTIGINAFKENKISLLTLGNNVQTIGMDAFSYNKLTSISIPNSVTSIGTDAFNCNQLTSVTLGNNVQTIGYGAFQGGTSTYNGTTYGSNQIASVTIPASVNSMACNAFRNQGGGITTQITYENPNFTCSN